MKFSTREPSDNAKYLARTKPNVGEITWVISTAITQKYVGGGGWFRFFQTLHFLLVCCCLLGVPFVGFADVMLRKGCQTVLCPALSIAPSADLAIFRHSCSLLTSQRGGSQGVQGDFRVSPLQENRNKQTVEYKSARVTVPGLRMKIKQTRKVQAQQSIMLGWKVLRLKQKEIAV